MKSKFDFNEISLRLHSQDFDSLITLHVYSAGNQVFGEGRGGWGGEGRGGLLKLYKELW